MHRLQSLLVAAVATASALLLPHFGSPATALTNCDVEHPANTAEELAFLEIINAYRAEHGLRRLTISTNLNREALWMARDMGTNGYFGHYDSLGRHPWTRSVDCGYPIPAGENLAAGWKQGDAQAAFELFKGSPSHNANMLGRDYRQIGIARVWAPDSEYGWYWATELGTTDDGTGPPPVERLYTSRVARLVWQQGAAEPASAIDRAAMPVTMLYAWDAEERTWRHYAPGLPSFLNTLDVVTEGMACWMVGSPGA